MPIVRYIQIYKQFYENINFVILVDFFEVAQFENKMLNWYGRYSIHKYIEKDIKSIYF